MQAINMISVPEIISSSRFDSASHLPFVDGALLEEVP
jgi:hypothetical protein